jgi:LysM repeat protein
MLIGVNAVLSLIISLGVVVAWDALKQPSQDTPTAVVETTLTATPTAAAPAVTSTPGPGEPVTYRVQPGDTLLTIANQFGVTVEEIMAANGLENPNFIQAGQELIIPVGGLPTAAPTATATVGATRQVAPPDTATPPATPTVTPTPLPVTPPATEPEVSIREIVDAGNLEEEAVFIFNGGRSVLMEGWTLSDAQDNTYTFPNLFLGTGGSVRVHTGAGLNSATDLFWNLDAPVWGEPGEVATLRDESGLAIDTLELP